MIRLLGYLLSLALLLLLQEFIFDNIHLGELINPYVYILFIVLLPLEIRASSLLLLGFVAGVAADVLSGTTGLHTIAATFLAFVRPAVVNLFVGKDEVHQGGVPTAGRLGTSRFLRYLFVMLLLFNSLLFTLEDWGGEVWIILLRILLSTLFCWICCYFLHLPLIRKKSLPDGR